QIRQDQGQPSQVQTGLVEGKRLAVVVGEDGVDGVLVDTTDAHHPRIAIPYTFVLDAERVIFKIYNGWWYGGRPTVDELRMDLRALLSRRRDWWYDDKPAPYARSATL